MPFADPCVTGLVGSGQLWQALAFVTRHPDVLLLMLLLSAAATLGASLPPRLPPCLLHSECFFCVQLVHYCLIVCCILCHPVHRQDITPGSSQACLTAIPSAAWTLSTSADSCLYPEVVLYSTDRVVLYCNKTGTGL